MALVSQNVQQIEIPHEPGEWLNLRPLSWLQLTQAREIQTRTVLERMRAMGGEVVGEFREEPSAEVPESEDESDPLSNLDRRTVLRGGVVGWSYREKFNRDKLDDLDEETAEWAARTIIGLNQRTDDDRKNVS